MPQPALVPWLADLTICSSTPSEVAVDRLEVEVGVVAARRERLAQAALQQPLGDAELLKKIAVVARVWGSERLVHGAFQFTLVRAWPERAAMPVPHLIPGRTRLHRQRERRVTFLA